LLIRFQACSGAALTLRPREQRYVALDVVFVLLGVAGLMLKPYYRGVIDGVLVANFQDRGK
jgi:hypothetical protein